MDGNIGLETSDISITIIELHNRNERFQLTVIVIGTEIFLTTEI